MTYVLRFVMMSRLQTAVSAAFCSNEYVHRNASAGFVMMSRLQTAVSVLFCSIKKVHRHASARTSDSVHVLMTGCPCRILQTAVSAAFCSI